MRAAGYVRVSAERQAKEGLSLDEQHRRVEAHIPASGLAWDRTPGSDRCRRTECDSRQGLDVPIGG